MIVNSFVPFTFVSPIPLCLCLCSSGACQCERAAKNVTDHQHVVSSLSPRLLSLQAPWWSAWSRRVTVSEYPAHCAAICARDHSAACGLYARKQVGVIDVT